MHYYKSGKIGGVSVTFPFIIGHECAGIVEDVGEAVTFVKPGANIAIDPAISCGSCQQCLSGRPHTCNNLNFLGLPGQLEGSLTEYIIMPEENCYPVKDNITLNQAVLVEPLSIGIYAADFMEKDNVKSIGILGVGPIGLSVLIAAKNKGFETIYVTDKIDYRLKLAKQNGARWAGNPNKTDICEQIESFEPDGLDAVFECCGEPEALDQALELLKPGGTLYVVGIPSDSRISFDAHTMRRKEIKIQNVRRQNDRMQAAIDLLDNAKGGLDFMISHTFPLSKTKNAFELVQKYKDGVIKAIIEL
jgi:L-iditol 2-dehydrogenase